MDFRRPSQSGGWYRAKGCAYGKPVIAICGSLGQGYTEVYKHGIDSAMSILPRIMTLEEAMRDGAKLLEDATERTVRAWAAGRAE